MIFECSEEMVLEQDTAKFCLFLEDAHFCISANMEEPKDLLLFLDEKAYELLWYGIQRKADEKGTRKNQKTRKETEKEIEEYCYKYKYTKRVIGYGDKRLIMLPLPNAAIKDMEMKSRQSIVIMISGSGLIKMSIGLEAMIVMDKRFCRKCREDKRITEMETCKRCSFRQMYKPDHPVCLRHVKENYHTKRENRIECNYVPFKRHIIYKNILLPYKKYELY
jgi:hypothetical protein